MNFINMLRNKWCIKIKILLQKLFHSIMLCSKCQFLFLFILQWHWRWLLFRIQHSIFHYVFVLLIYGHLGLKSWQNVVVKMQYLSNWKLISALILPNHIKFKYCEKAKKIWINLPYYYIILIWLNIVHIFWEGHKLLRNLPLTFDTST